MQVFQRAWPGLAGAGADIVGQQRASLALLPLAASIVARAPAQSIDKMLVVGPTQRLVDLGPDLGADLQAAHGCGDQASGAVHQAQCDARPRRDGWLISGARQRELPGLR